MRYTLVLVVVGLSLTFMGCTEGGSLTDCAAGQSRPCVTTCGSTGSQVCVSGTFSDQCSAPVEACNGKDDNCDGQVDEGDVCGGTCQSGETQACVTACQSTGSQTCGADGTWGTCAVPVETCNNIDDDCDGQVDEDSVCAGDCTAGAQEQCVTPCETIGSKTCGADGKWLECIPPAETCNAKDDNCNGQVDEDVVEDCETECGKGLKSCQNGHWGQCTSGKPGDEVCDGKDNDCDGKTDEDDAGQPLVQECGQQCGGGTQSCVNGQWEACSVEATIEECNGVDDDCDGQTDENCDCEEGTTKECGLGIGECQVGTQDCVGGKWSDCGGDNYQQPEPEKCDKLDNDCDGFTDESTDVEPIVGVGEVCGTPNKSQGGTHEDPCTIGVTQCIEGQLQCAGGVDPSAEVCDGVDNDCNGDTDENQTGDDAEENETCATGHDLGELLEDTELAQTQLTIYPGDDVDWYQITAKELGGWCVPFTSEGPYKFTVTLSNIPVGFDYDLCVWPAKDTDETDGAKCEDLTDYEGAGVVCEDLAIWKFDQDPETYTATWSGKCGSTDDRVFRIKVVNYDKNADNQCTEPYTLTFKMEKTD